MIGFSSDLLVDVAKAADPQRAAAARRRLETLAASGAPRFDGLLASPATEQFRAPLTASRSPVPNGNDLQTKTARRQGNDGDAYRALGAVLLQKAFESIIPASSSTGASKSASAVWKSMLAQQLADVASVSVFPSRDASRQTAAKRASS